MKIVIIGYSGSGKSTLARTLGRHYGAEVLHLDQIYWIPNWQSRELTEQRALVGQFMDAHNAWVIDGNYRQVLYERRLAEADEIVMLLFGRFACLTRAFRRYLRNRGRFRPDMSEGCEEKFDAEFIRWILLGGRNKQARERYRRTARDYGGKVTILRSQRELDGYLARLCEAPMGNPAGIGGGYAEE